MSFDAKCNALRAKILAGASSGHALLPVGAHGKIPGAVQRGPAAGGEPQTFERVSLPPGWTLAEVPRVRQWVAILDDQGRERAWAWFKPAHKGKAERSRVQTLPALGVALTESTVGDVITHGAEVFDRRTAPPTVLQTWTATDAEGNRGIWYEAQAYLQALLPEGVSADDPALWDLPAGVYE